MFQVLEMKLDFNLWLAELKCSCFRASISKSLRSNIPFEGWSFSASLMIGQCVAPLLGTHVGLTSAMILAAGFMQLDLA